MFHMRPRGESQVYFFPVVFGSLLTAFSFVPTFTRFTEKHKLAVFTGSTYLSLVLLFVICCAKYGQNWFGAAALGTLLGYIAVFAPFLLRRYMPQGDADLFSPYTFCCSSPA